MHARLASWSLASAFLLAFACGRDGSSEAERSPAPGDLGTPGTTPDGSAPEIVGADGGADEALEETVPAVRFVGRFDRTDLAGPLCGWPGCRIVARFDGTEVSARLDERTLDWMDGSPSEWDVSIDGQITKKLVLEPGVHDYPLAARLAPGVHVVELYKRSEGQNGTTRYLGFDFGGGALLPPPNRAKRRIEIIGDSTPAGYGIEEGDCQPPLHAAKYQDFHKSFGARLGAMFAADVQGTVYSGKGVVRNIWRPDRDTLPIVYERANPIEKTSVFDLSSFVPDVIVMSFGGLDFAIGKPWDDGPTPLADWIAAYDAFVVRIRAAYPQAHVFILVSPSLTDAFPEGRDIRTNVMTGVSDVVGRRNAAGDARVYPVVPSPAVPAELTGCEGHPNARLHQRIAGDLAATIRAKTGW